MKDLPRSDRGGSRWASNIANESVRSSGPANVQTTSAAGNSGTASAAINSARPETQNNLAEAAVPTSRAAVSNPNTPVNQLSANLARTRNRVGELTSNFVDSTRRILFPAAPRNIAEGQNSNVISPSNAVASMGAGGQFNTGTTGRVTRRSSANSGNEEIELREVGR